MRPWKAVLDDLLLSEATAHHYPEDGSFPDFKEEALRRFAAGSSVPSQDKLEDIYSFLVDLKFLSENEMKEGIWDYAAALSLTQLFNQKAGQSYWSTLHGMYRAEVDTKRHELKGFTRSDLHFKEVEGEDMVSAKHDWFTWLYDRLPEAEFKKRYGDQVRQQTGYGFPTYNGGMIAFFKDGMTGNVEILLVTDSEAGADQAGWFRAAKINLQMTASATMPDVSFDEFNQPRFLYQRHQGSKA